WESRRSPTRPDLSRRGVLTNWDVEPFALYCDLVDQAWLARKLLDPGLLVKGRRDGVITTPAWKIYRNAVAEIRALAQEFALTPSARTLIRVRGLSDAPIPPAELLPIDPRRLGRGGYPPSWRSRWRSFGPSGDIPSEG